MGDEDACTELESVYKPLHFFRNICSPLLAKLLARELKNSKFIQDSQRGNGEDATHQKNLFDLLTKVGSRGKNARDKQRKRGKLQSSDTYEINNLKDNKDTLERVQVGELLERGEASKAVAILRELDVKFLLCVLVNYALGITFSDEVKRALDALRELRNSNTHQDGDPELLKKLWTETEQVHKYLYGETDTFKKLKKSWWPEETWDQILEDVRQEIDERYQTSSPKHHTAQLTILHHQREEHGQPGTAVQNLLDFLVQKQKSCCREPQPIVLYGEPGAGKSSVLDSLLDTLREQNAPKDFLMVVKVRNTDVNSKKEFWKQIFTDRCPQAIKNHKDEEVQQVLKLKASKFLFLVDCNLQKETLDKLISYMGHGLWVLSFQGASDYSKRFHLLEVAPLSEDQIHQVLQDRPEMTPRDRDLVLRLFQNYEHKDLIKTPEMVHLFADICSEKGSHIPFYELIRRYIDKKVKTDETMLIELGKKAFENIKSQRHYTEVECALRPLFKRDANGYWFKYRKVEDYLAAKYVVADPEKACESWLDQAKLFTTVFHVVCFLWSEQDNGIQANHHFIRKYLEKIFRGDREMSKDTSDRKDCNEKKRKQDEATSEGRDCTGKKRKPDTATSEVNDCKGKKMKKETAGEGKDCVTIHKPFERWICLSKFAKDYQSNEGLLQILADMLTPFDTWLFRYTTMTPELIDSLSQVLKRVTLPPKLTIKMESGTNVEVLRQLWIMLRSHSVLLSNSAVHLTIHYQGSNVAKYEETLAAFCDTIYNTIAPLYIKHYSGPLLCSKTPQFFEGSCLQEMGKYALDVYITDLASLSMVLAQNKNRKCIKRLRVRLMEMTQPLEQSQSFPRDLTIIYFEGLQKLLESYKPDCLCSLKIHEVYIHDNFHLDLTRFTKLELLSIRFVQKEKQEKVGRLSREEWLPRLVKHLRLPARVGRLMMRNMAFLDDSSASALVTLSKKVTYQRLVLLDTDLSIAKFREIMGDLVASSCRAGTEDAAAIPPAEGVRRPRLQKAVREDRRRHKPEGKELIVTSEATLFKNPSSAEEWPAARHNFVNLVKAVDACPALSINYSGKCVAVRKDVCGDLFVKCPLPFLDDTMAKELDRHPELGPVLEALALAERISLHCTELSCYGALRLLDHLKERMMIIGRTEPFKLTIGSWNPTICSKTKEELKHGFVEEIYREDKLAQFNFSCKYGCHFFKKAIDGTIYFNDERLRDNRKRAK